jgi:hypothetical protein
MSCNSTPVRTATNKRTTGADKDVQKLEPFYTVGENANNTAAKAVRGATKAPQKTKNVTTI